LDDESLSYKRRLDTYKQAQTHQAALISRLQAKILQYKQRCTGWLPLSIVYFIHTYIGTLQPSTILKIFSRATNNKKLVYQKYFNKPIFFFALQDLEGQLDPLPMGHGGDDSPVGRGSLGGPPPPPPPLDDHDLDPDAALRLLDDERRKNERIKQLNTQLKQQLDESHGTNENLTTDLQKLHADWERLRDELLAKEEVSVSQCVLLFSYFSYYFICLFNS